MRYISFFEMFHGAGSFQQRRERIHWYFRSGNFKLLVAVADNRYVGQSCSYKTTAIIHGKEQEWWWGVDSFVLEEMRGRSIGKALQKKLHEDCPNFSSASYSSLNGIIKKKCGGHEILDYHRYYCPVSCWLTLYSELVLKKFISRKIAFPRIRLPYCYSLLNRPQATGKYTINELVPSDYNDQLSAFVEECLRNSSFHIHRSNTYLRWKYLQNPSIKYIGIEIKNNGQREAVVFFTDVYKGKYTVSAVMVSKILDAIILPESSLTQKMLLSFVVEYFRKRGTKLDGLLTLIPSGYWPQIQYPASHPSYMLSTLHAPLLENGYLAYSDQDMEQMYEH